MQIRKCTHDMMRREKERERERLLFFFKYFVRFFDEFVRSKKKEKFLTI